MIKNLKLLPAEEAMKLFAELVSSHMAFYGFVPVSF